ncbi:hypothetical protein SAICODRAFT_69659 [Saitoella complicata NRRL Y-17804]|uniref:Apple domain-containing protein n=1 Tax=Saitoella complicata (strain BCRC 22490 / CBS 7301 / JCM 7358 / NBRC 10748 / NRRL Y-17804) TaxID=698492 RepID=A0A0E9NP26_SAICN|nr:uncharacterized protein SAICODRAFT_69659 [Saitoella complicata NRRL Y-17804]ODQ55025.1 hypothetical protein SAICODRAFT_69659 [Saitoella complicata NRRL Y-17804]GAO51589.1 hypothetical protein G7K_5688-t1 [Saitoella complicata NRRL Y-17804]
MRFVPLLAAASLLNLASASPALLWRRNATTFSNATENTHTTISTSTLTLTEPAASFDAAAIAAIQVGSAPSLAGVADVDSNTATTTQTHFVTVDSPITSTEIGQCAQPTVTFGQLITDSAQLITSATTDYAIASTSISGAQDYSYYVQTSSAAAVIAYSDLFASVRTLTITEYVDGTAIATGTYEVAATAVATPVLTTLTEPEEVVIGGTTRTLTEGGSVAYLTTTTTTVTSTILAAGSSSPTSTSGWSWSGAEVLALCRSFVGTLTEDVTGTVTSTVYQQSNTTSTLSVTANSTYPVTVPRTATERATSTSINYDRRNVTSSVYYNVSVPSTTRTATTSTYVSLSELTETPEPVTSTYPTTEVESTATTTTSTSYSTWSSTTPTAPTVTVYKKRTLSLEDEFQAAVRANSQSVRNACLANFEMPTVTVSKEVLAVETIVEKDGTVVATHVSVASTPVFVTTIVATATSQVVDMLNQTITSSFTQSVPTSVTYVASTATDITVQTLNSTIITTLPAATISAYSTTTETAVSTSTIVSTVLRCPIPDSQRRSAVGTIGIDRPSTGQLLVVSAASGEDCCVVCYTTVGCSAFVYWGPQFCVLATSGTDTCSASSVYLIENEGGPGGYLC